MPTALDDVRVEVSFDAPGVASPTFVDLTTRVQMGSSIGISRGQTDPFSEGVTAGRCSLVFDNTDGALTPGNPASPYYPNVRPQNRLRVTYRDRSVPGNLVPVASSGFESGTVGAWTTGGSVAPTITNSTTRARFGTRSMLVTWGAGGFLPFAGLTVSGLVVGRRYTASFYAWVPTGNPAVTVVGAGIGLGSTSTLFDAWSRPTLTFIATEATMNLQVWPASTPTAGQQVWIDAVQVDEGTGGTFTSIAPPITYRFTGYVEEWPLVWPDGGQERALSPVVAYDIVSRLSRAPEFRSVIEETLDLTGRVWHYPLSEGSESITAGDVVGNGSASLSLRTIGTGSTVTFGGGTGPDTDGSTAVSFADATPGNSTYLTTTLVPENLAVPPPNFGLTYVATFASESLATQTVMFAKDNYGASVEIGIAATGYVYGTIIFPWGAWLGTGVVKQVRTTPTTFLDGKTHVVELSIDDNGTGFGQTRMRLYVDGALVDTLTWSGWYGIAPTNLDVGVGFNGTISHVALLSTGIDAATAATHNAACTTGFAGENTGTRISRALDWAGVPASLRNIGVGASGVDHIDPRGMTPWAYIALVANTEGGLAAADTLGRVWFRDRTAGYDTSQAVAVTASSDDLGGGVEIRTGLDSIANDVRVTRQRGATSRAADATSIDTYGAFGYDLTIACPTDREAYDRATWVLAIRGGPAPTIPSLDLDGLTGDAASAVRQIDLDDRIAVTGFPSQAPTVASLSDLRVYGYNESIGSAGWSVTANTGTFLYIRPMIADDDVYGLADGDNRAVY